MQGLGILPLFLLLPAVIRGDFPDFDDEDDNFYACEGDACVYRTMFLYVEQNIQVPNKSVTYEEYAYLDVNTASLLADCAPSLSVGDIATTIKTCQEVDWKYWEACQYRKKGWLGQDGKTVNDSLATAFDEIEGVSENIAKCLEWDGNDDYDYDYYGDYHYLEEFDNTQVRTKRDLKMNVPEFMKQKIRNRRGAKEKKNNGENQSGTRSRNVKKKKTRKGKNRNKGKTQRNNRKGSNGKGGNNGNKKPKIKRNKNRKGNKSGKKGKTRNNNKKKGERKNRKEEKKKEEKKKKKEEKKERKMLKQIDLDSKPSEEILNKLECVERAIEYGLEKCGEKIFTNLDLH